MKDVCFAGAREHEATRVGTAEAGGSDALTPKRTSAGNIYNRQWGEILDQAAHDRDMP
jgi:hypothetical protein